MRICFICFCFGWTASLSIHVVLFRVSIVGVGIINWYPCPFFLGTECRTTTALYAHTCVDDVDDDDAVVVDDDTEDEAAATAGNDEDVFDELEEEEDEDDKP